MLAVLFGHVSPSFRKGLAGHGNNSIPAEKHGPAAKTGGLRDYFVTLRNGIFSAYERVDMELSDFHSIGISSEAGRVSFTYLGNEPVNAKCRSENSSVRVSGAFNKFKDAEKTLKISAYERIDLIGSGQR